MDHGEMGGMSWMMSQEDMTALEEAQGTGAARLYLEQMPSTKVRSTWTVTRWLTARIPMQPPWPNKLSTTRRPRSPRCSKCSLTYDRSPSFSDPEDRNLKKRDNRDDCHLLRAMGRCHRSGCTGMDVSSPSGRTTEERGKLLCPDPWRTTHYCPILTRPPWSAGRAALMLGVSSE